MKTKLLTRLTVCAALLASPVAANAAPPSNASRPLYADKIGVDLEPPNEGSRTKAWVDLGRGLRPFSVPGGSKATPTDAQGWPTSDGQTVIFDIRPVPAWSPPIDDPAAFQPDWSGTYHLSFTGQAIVKAQENDKISVRQSAYHAKTNTTTAEVVVPKGAGLLLLAFTNTRRLPTGAANTGITNLKLIRPGYPADTKQIFTNEFVRSLRPFRVLRFMDWLSTNANPGFYGDAGHHTLHWANRHVPLDATQQDVGDKKGVAWEFIVALANETNKDVWINIPVAADDNYVRELARLLKTTLKPGLKIYIEHSNEVWNFGFPQYIYNKLAAVDEVKTGHSLLNNDGAQSEEVWAHRRHAARLVQITKIFADVYGQKQLGSLIRPVYASWLIMPKSHYADIMAWVNKTYGPPKSYFYAIAGAAYFNVQKASKAATVPELLAAMRQNSDDNQKFRTAIGTIAKEYGVKHAQYEVGSDVGGGATDNVANRILANRDAGMRDIILHDARDNWFARGGDLYIYFAFCSAYSRYGAWGLSETIDDLQTPKWQAIYTLTGTTAPAYAKRK